MSFHEHARSLGMSMKTAVFESRDSWGAYALDALHTVEQIAGDLALSDHLHLWPDKTLGSKWVMKLVPDAAAHDAWLQSWWSRISEWPTEV